MSMLKFLCLGKWTLVQDICRVRSRCHACQSRVDISAILFSTDGAACSNTVLTNRQQPTFMTVPSGWAYGPAGNGPAVHIKSVLLLFNCQ